MGNFLIIERFRWFDQQIRRNRFPNAATLSDQFEISPKTAQRTITFLRDRYLAPLENTSLPGAATSIPTIPSRCPTGWPYRTRFWRS